jgi:hypothetical protein
MYLYQAEIEWDVKFEQYLPRATMSTPLATKSRDSSRDSQNCSICIGSLESCVILEPCGHEFCFKCINKWRNSSGAAASTCPNCRKPITGLEHRPLLTEIVRDPRRPSSYYRDAQGPPKYIFCETVIAQRIDLWKIHLPERRCNTKIPWPHQAGARCCPGCGSKCKIHASDLTQRIPCLGCNRFISSHHWAHPMGCCKCRSRCIFHGPGSKSKYRAKNDFIPNGTKEPDSTWLSAVCNNCSNITGFRGGCVCCSQCNQKCAQHARRSWSEGQIELPPAWFVSSKPITYS